MASYNRNNDDKKADRNPYLAHNLNSSAMTPSIIHTINNTSPTPPTNLISNINNNGNTVNKTKRPVEQYESYIEDSFVGHWEREDDDPDNPYHKDNNGQALHNNDIEEEDAALHPSTIEFDFDSFGPESFIYTPTATTEHLNNTKNKPNPVQIEVINKPEAVVKEAEAIAPCSSAIKETIKLDVGNLAVSQNIPPIQDTMGSESVNPIHHLVEAAQIDLKVIEPYKKVISHAGYCHHLDTTVPAPGPGEPAPAVIVFSACYLPDRSRRDYNYVMDHLFLYVLSSLHELIADDYILIYLHNTQPSSSVGNYATISSISSNLLGGLTSSTNNVSNNNTSSEDLHQNNLPTFAWMKRCYQMIDRKLRKNLKILYLVKPTFWLKTVVIMCKPFISTKFSKKLRFIDGMDSLRKCIPVDKLTLPASANNL